jgi:hypothetical protein
MVPQCILDLDKCFYKILLLNIFLLRLWSDWGKAEWNLANCLLLLSSFSSMYLLFWLIIDFSCAHIEWSFM